ncbi:MAG: helix-hairpin-helix domain-containing protein [Thermodesulfobacteriota bacterium]|nr:helix-hairpin-helix domain-containing protein [Thermodesulfobacteriota bacterium]
MNNVTLNKANHISRQDKGTGKGVALFFCVLFCLFQIFTTFFSSSRSLLFERELQLTSEETLGFSDAGNVEKHHRITALNSPATYRFAPFFFQPIAINYCDKTMLMSVKGIGPDLAENIISTRELQGGFAKPDDLLQIKGIGTVRLQKFTPYFSFSIDDE